jgi:hypothetical protein
MSLEQFLANITLEELEELRKIKEAQERDYNIYSFSQFDDVLLEKLFDIEEKLDETIFAEWFSETELDSREIDFLERLLLKEREFIKYYYEEDLKIKFISAILNHIDFCSKEQKIKDFYETKLSYKTEQFELKGNTDYMVSSGLKRAKKPYFFLQEFKRSRTNDDPQSQLLAQLISAVELNSWKSIKGAYIVGAIWNFVILERVEKHKYKYYISQNFDSTKIEDLKAIYRNLLFVKNEIIEMVKRGD